MGIRVLIVDDQRAAREILRALLEMHVGFEVVGEADSGEAALELVGPLRPDVIVLDVLLPGWTGIETTARILAAFPDVGVVGVSLLASPGVRREMERAGAASFVPKDDARTALPAAVRLASRRVAR